MPNYNNELNKILLKTSGTISVPSGREDNTELAGIAVKNLADYGLVIDERGLNLLSTSSREEIEKWYFDTLSILEDEKDISLIKPTYPNFPNGTMNRIDWELMINELKSYWNTNPSQESDEINSATNGIENSTQQTTNNTNNNNNNNDNNNDNNTQSGRDTINLGYEPESKVVINTTYQQNVGLKTRRQPKIIKTMDGRDRRLVIDTTGRIFSNILRTKNPTKAQIKEIVNPFINNVQNWNIYVNQCTNRDMLTYLYARALIEGKKTENMPVLKAKDYLKVIQQVNWMREHPIYEVRPLNEKENEKVEEYCRKNHTTPEVARQQLFAEQATTKKDFSEGMQIKVGPKYETNDIKAHNNTFVKILSCGDKLSGHRLRVFVATGLDKIQDLETEISGKKSEKLWRAIFDKQLHIKSDFPQLERLSIINYKLQNNIPLINLDREIEKAKKEERYEDILKLLKNRPNLFVKRINEMLNLPINDSEKRVKFAMALLETAKETLPKASSEDLITFISYLKSRTRNDRLKVHNVNGRLFLDKEKNYTPLPPKTAETFAQIAKMALRDRLTSNKDIGVVYIDPNVEKIALPKSRDVEMDAIDNPQINVYSNGSRTPLVESKDKTGKIRFMIWSDKKTSNKNIGDETSSITRTKEIQPSKNSIIDISASFFKDEEGSLQHQRNEDLAWYANKQNSYDGCVFSGNSIINNNAIEYIDLDLDSLQKAEIAYVMLYVNIWSNDTTLSDEAINFAWENREEFAIESTIIGDTNETIERLEEVDNHQLDIEMSSIDTLNEIPQDMNLHSVRQDDVAQQEPMPTTPNNTTINELKDATSIIIEGVVQSDRDIVRHSTKAMRISDEENINGGRIDVNDTNELHMGTTINVATNPIEGLRQTPTKSIDIKQQNSSTQHKVEESTIPQNNLQQHSIKTKDVKQSQTNISNGIQIGVQQSNMTQTNMSTRHIKKETTSSNNQTKEHNVEQYSNHRQQIVKPSKAKANIHQIIGNAKGIVPVIIDVNKREIIWTNVLDRSTRANVDMRSFTKYANIIIDMYGKNDRMTIADMAKLMTNANNGTLTSNPAEANVLFTTKKYEGQTIGNNQGVSPQEALNIITTQQNAWLKHFIVPESVIQSPEMERIQKQASKSLLDTFEAIIIEQRRKNSGTHQSDNYEAAMEASNAAEIAFGIDADQQLIEQKMEPDKRTERAMKELDKASERFDKDLEDEQKMSDIIENFGLYLDKDNDGPVIEENGDEEIDFT